MSRTGHTAVDEALLRRVGEIAREAGNIALGYRARGQEDWQKEKGEPVSEADLAVDRYLREMLLGITSGFGWLSEERADNKDRLGKDLVWVVDPIDGTRAFLKGRADFCISIGLVHRGRPRMGVIHAPEKGGLYTALSGEGARREGEPISTSKCADIKGCHIQGDDWAFRREHGWPEMEFSKDNSMALRIMRVAEGACDAVIPTRPKSDWDLAAADCILAEAGGLLLDETGERLVYNQPETKGRRIIGANRALMEKLLPLWQASAR